MARDNTGHPICPWFDWHANYHLPVLLWDVHELRHMALIMEQLALQDPPPLPLPFAHMGLWDNPVNQIMIACRSNRKHVK